MFIILFFTGIFFTRKVERSLTRRLMSKQSKKYEQEMKGIREIRNAALETLRKTYGADTIMVRMKKKGDKTIPTFYKWVHRSDGTVEDRYLRKNRLANEQQAIEVFFAKKVLSVVNKCMREALDAAATEQKLQELYEALYDIFGELTPKKYLPYSEKVRRWETKARSSPYLEEGKKYSTIHGEMVRSKFEVMVADALFSAGIPYQYEQKLELHKNLVVLPDFTILDKNRKMLVFLEACGLMNDPVYAARTIQKISDYESAGIYLGDRLMLVFDLPDTPFDPKVFVKRLKKLFS